MPFLYFVALYFSQKCVLTYFSAVLYLLNNWAKLLLLTAVRPSSGSGDKFLLKQQTCYSNQPYKPLRPGASKNESRLLKMKKLSVVEF